MKPQPYFIIEKATELKYDTSNYLIPYTHTFTELIYRYKEFLNEITVGVILNPSKQFCLAVSISCKLDLVI